MDRIATAIIEPRSLVREALVSLMENNACDVVRSIASTAELDIEPAVIEKPRLVILGTLAGDQALSVTTSIRRLWPEAKIIVLFERASPADIQKLMALDIDGCIPMFVSPRTLMGTLHLILAKDLRILVLGDATLPRAPIAAHYQEQPISSVQLGVEVATTLSPLDIPINRLSSWNEPPDSCVRYNSSGLSAREEQVLKALIEGHSNKVIARMCSVTEATVKVHMKSILRKIRVANRTQAAIWALAHGYVAGAAKTEAANGALLGTELPKENRHGL
jgi:two-component system nitrate/nitrite response regulator NarL